jgi:septum formation protein
MRFILASSSPRRRDLLLQAGFDFDVRAAGIEEVPQPGELPEDFARRAAQDKALAVAARAPADSLILGADTVVVIDGEILGKPADPQDAACMLRRLSGRAHRVITGVCLARSPRRIEASNHETTRVTFRSLDEEEIRSYVESGEPLDKAGAYAIQGLASKFVAGISGCYFNVVGLPIPMVYEMLKPFLKQEASRQQSEGSK